MSIPIVEIDLIASIVERHRGHPAALLTVLQDLQDELNWLPRGTLEAVSRELDIPLTQVYRVATFYTALSLEPRGRHLIRVCTGTACHLKGAGQVIDAIQRCVGVGPGKTSEDMQFTLETVHCLGACAMAPVMTVDGEYHGQVRPGDVSGILDEATRKDE